MSKAILKSLAVLGALAISTSAYASPVSLTYNGQTSAQNATITSPVTTGASAGAFKMGGDLGDFIAFCVDVFYNIASPSNYEVVSSLASLVPNSYATGAGEWVQKLFDSSYAGLDLFDSARSAGFQLALWEILYDAADLAAETTSGFWNLAGGDFTATAGTDVITMANSFLDATASYTGSQLYNITYYQADPADSSQNLISVAPAPVPLPAAGLLLLAGLAGLGAAARRRKAA